MVKGLSQSLCHSHSFHIYPTLQCSANNLIIKEYHRIKKNNFYTFYFLPFRTVLIHCAVELPRVYPRWSSRPCDTRAHFKLRIQEKSSEPNFLSSSTLFLQGWSVNCIFKSGSNLRQSNGWNVGEVLFATIYGALY